MEKKRAIVALCALFAVVFTAGLFASNRWQSWKYADASIRWYNGGTGDYYNIYQEESITDGDPGGRVPGGHTCSSMAISSFTTRAARRSGVQVLVGTPAPTS